MTAGPTTTATLALTLQDRTSSTAVSAARSLEQLKGKIESDTKALRQMQAAQSRLRGGTVQDIAVHKKLRDQIAAQKAVIASTQQKYLQLGGTFQETAGQAKGLAAFFSSGAIAAGAAGIATALLAVATSAVSATVALLSYALAQADARRSELLHLEGLTTIRRWYGLARGSGRELQEQIDRVSDSSTLGRGAVTGYAEQLYRMGLRGRNARAALEAVTLAAQVQGEAQAARTASWAAGLARTGGDVERLAALMRSRLGGIAERQTLSFSNQLAKLHERISRLFGDVRIEGFLRALNSITTLFSQSTAEGQALKAIIEALFNPLFDSVGTATPLVRRFFQGMVLGTQQVVIAILQVRSWVHRTWGTDWQTRIDGTTTALGAGKVVVYALAGALVLAAAAAAVLAVSLALVLIPVVAIAGAVVGAAVAIGVGLTKAYDYVASFEGRFRNAGNQLVKGLANGIFDAQQYVRSAVTSVASSAESTLRDVLGIHSPSRVFAQLGAQVPRGFAAGVDETTPVAAGATNDMAQATVAGGAGASIRGGDRTITIGELHVHAPSGQTDDLVQKIRDELQDLLEGVQIEMGGAS